MSKGVVSQPSSRRECSPSMRHVAEAHPDEWELFLGALRDLRSDRMREGFWYGVPEGLTGRKVQSQ